MEFSDFWVFGWKFTKFLVSYLRLQVSFSLNFAAHFSIMRDNSSVLFLVETTWFGQKAPIKVQDFRLLTAHIKFHQICTLIDSFCWKYIKIVSHYPGHWSKIWRKTDLLFQKWQEFGEFWLKHLKVSKICTFIGSYCAKYLVIWKMTWGIWQIFTRALESVKIGTLMGSFCPKWKMYELKMYRGVICHDNEEWCKIWRGINLSFQNWHKESEESWLEHSEI